MIIFLTRTELIARIICNFVRRCCELKSQKHEYKENIGSAYTQTHTHTRAYMRAYSLIVYFIFEGDKKLIYAEESIKKKFMQLRSIEILNIKWLNAIFYLFLKFCRNVIASMSSNRSLFHTFRLKTHLFSISSGHNG